FEEQADRTPNNIAVVFEGKELTYKEINEQSNQLGAYLRETYKIQAEDLIGIKLERSEQMIVAILGILKSGAAYVPIDLSYPQERIDYIEKDSNCKIVVDIEVLKCFNELKDRYLKSNVEKIINPQNLAYVIYTSGTTGNPKGVMIEHTSLVNRLEWMQKAYVLSDQDVILQKTSYSFDVSVWELFWWIYKGSQVCMLKPEGQKDPKELIDCIEKNKVSVLHFVPSMLTLFLDYLKENGLGNERLKSLKQVFVSGETLSVNQNDKFFAQFTNVSLMNLYGPTEATIDVSYFNCSKNDTLIPIGKPIDNTQLFVLNNNLHPVSIGVIGKLYISGSGLARGYLNQPELTAEKFISNPFIEGARMYDTGDLGRWLPDGNIEFLGREDHQVKIRGFRIELGEIEAAISQYSEDVLQVIVEAKEINQEKALVAYYVSKSEIEKSEIRSHLQNKLPEYMVPSFYVEIESIPLTANGKVDRKALPSVTGEDVIKKEYVAPRNKEEQLIVDIWALVLKQEAISVKDSFYNLGGDSIKSIQVVSRLKQKGYTLKVEDILRNPIVEDLAKLIKVDISIISQDMIKGDVVLTPIQRFFFGSEQIPNKNHYNQSVLLKSKIPINESFLKETVSILVHYHDALRMRYELVNDIWQQYNLDSSEDCYKIRFFDLTQSVNANEELHRLGEEMQSSFSISSGTLFQIGHFRMIDGDRLALIIHHLVVDGVSWRILLDDLSTVYESLENNNIVQLPLKTDSFQRWASLLESYAKSPAQQQERTYWENLSQTSIALLPKDFEVTQGKAPINDSLSFTLDIELSQKLQTKVHGLYSTEINDVLLTALALSIKDIFGVEKSVIEIEGHGREEIIDGVDVGRTIGWFTSLYPFILDISDNRYPEIVSVKESLRKIPNKGIGYGILKYMDNSFESELSPSIQFNYLGNFGSNISDKDNSRFEFAHESVGAQVCIENTTNDILLNVSGIIVAEQLSITFGYSSFVFEKQTIEKLTASYHKQLRKLINSLSQNKAIGLLTPSDLSYKGLSIEQLSFINKEDTIEDIYELSPLQQGLYYHWLVDQSSSMYFMQTSYRLYAENLDIDNVKRAYQYLVNRYEIFRTSFSSNYDVLLQIVHKEAFIDFSFKSVKKDKDSALYLQKIKEEDRSRGFDLNKPTQMRLQVVDLGHGIYEFIWSHHHILMDGWCMSILINDFSSILNALNNKQIISLEKPVKYANYIKWLSKINKETSLEYWKKYLDGFVTATEIPFKNKREIQSKEVSFKSEEICLDGEVFQNIKNTCSGLEITTNTFIQGAWGYLLSRYNDSKDVVFGSVVSGRPPELVGIEDMVGLFSNTIPTRVQYNESDTVKDFLKQLHAEAIKSTDFHYVSLAEVQSQSPIGMELINNLMIFENFVVKDNVGNILNAPEIIGKETSFQYADSHDESNYNFVTTIYPFKSSLKIEFKFDSNIFDVESIRKMVSHLEAVIQIFSADNSRLIEDIDYLSQAEKQQLLEEFNDTGVAYPK
ncbi:amino acid adenylation domain-containing protein, partial [Flavobacterium sp. HJSW_4]|uniref:amino acid adenylation domain-containing protein n=1 Tax=Flavobacterium sp. HJSW_4 TaxID=3344660 RepID=UPI0035F398CF